MDALIKEVEAIAERVYERKFIEAANGCQDDTRATPAAVALRDRLACINAKEHISIAEAALLVNCSDGHIRNLVGKARGRQTKQPIPFSDLDGVTVFNRLALLEWAHAPKHKLEASRAKDGASKL